MLHEQLLLQVGIPGAVGGGLVGLSFEDFPFCARLLCCKRNYPEVAKATEVLGSFLVLPAARDMSFVM